MNLSDNMKEDFKEYGLAEPHEFLEESLFGLRNKTPLTAKNYEYDPIEKFQAPELFLHDLNTDITSPKISQKPKINLINSEINRNYCSLVEYKSVSPKRMSQIKENINNKSHFENYLKDFKENKGNLQLVSNEFERGEVLSNLDTNKEPNKRFFINSIVKNKLNETGTSKYSSNSNNNYMKVIENQKRFIGNFHKQVYNTISGRISSPSYQEYLEQKKN